MEDDIHVVQASNLAESVGSVVVKSDGQGRFTFLWPRKWCNNLAADQQECFNRERQKIALDFAQASLGKDSLKVLDL